MAPAIRFTLTIDAMLVLVMLLVFPIGVRAGVCPVSKVGGAVHPKLCQARARHRRMRGSLGPAIDVFATTHWTSPFVASSGTELLPYKEELEKACLRRAPGSSRRQPTCLKVFSNLPANYWIGPSLQRPIAETPLQMRRAESRILTTRSYAESFSLTRQGNAHHTSALPTHRFLSYDTASSRPCP